MVDYQITEARRAEYRRVSVEARIAKQNAMKKEGKFVSIHPEIAPELDPEDLMPALESNGLKALSLFSGGGGMDLGFERAGFKHVASYDILDICGDTLRYNRPEWKVFSGVDGDVKDVDFSLFKGSVDVIHGGPPCQPFSTAGSQKGKDDERNMWPEFVRAVNVIKPRAFVAENVPGILNEKFKDFVKGEIIKPLSAYTVVSFKLNAAMFGVPQNRKRVFFVGFLDAAKAKQFKVPIPTHEYMLRHNNAHQSTMNAYSAPRTMGVRAALGLPDVGFDSLAPTLRSAFTGKRNTTSILNSTAGQKAWEKLKLWPNGVAENRTAAQRFLAKNGHQRLSVHDCALLQGFPESWVFKGAVYQVLGQIGNSVAPPVAYRIAAEVAGAING